MKAIVFLYLLFSVFVAKCDNSETYLKVGTRVYSYDDKGQRIEKQSYDRENNLVSFVRYIYDEQGNKIETLKYKSDSTLLTRYIYIYKDKLKVKSIKITGTENKESYRRYTYNSLGQCVFAQYISDGKKIKTIKSCYNSKGEYKSRKYFDKNGKLSREQSYKYTYKNNRIVRKSKFSSGDMMISESVYEYDEKGNKRIYYLNYFSGRRKSKKRVYKYNENGLCIYSEVYELIK